MGGASFLSPPVRMHDGLLCIVFCMYVCLSVCDLTKIHTRQKVVRQKVIYKAYSLYVCDLTKIPTRKKVTRQKVLDRPMECGTLFFQVQVIP